MLLGILPFLFFILCATLIFSYRRTRPEYADARVSLVVACILSAAWLVAGTELLSLFRAIRFWPLLLWWAAPSMVLAILLARRGRDLGRPSEVLSLLPQLDSVDWLLLALIGLALGSSAASAWFSAPNNWDSMAYHLPRQVHWIQSHSVSHFLRPFYREILKPPFAEFAGMNLMLLSGGDRWANMVQWVSLVMVVIVVSLIAKDIGAGRKGQLLAGLLTVSAPIIYIFASNTKNSLVLAMWVCMLAWWAIRTFIDREHDLARTTLIGTTLGLTALTKGTAFIFAPASCLLICFAIIRSARRHFWKPALIITACAFLVPLGHWTRNYAVSGSPLGTKAATSIINKSFAPTVLASNILRNLTIHLGTTNETLNKSLMKSVDEAHVWLGADPQDQRSTFVKTPYEVKYTPGQEDSTPAGVHVVLIALALAFSAPLYRRLKTPAFFVYLFIPCAGFILFCWLLKWQIWHSRFHIPLLCLFMPPVAVALTKAPARRFLAPLAVAGTLVALYPTFTNNYRPLLGEHSVFRTDRTEEMFRARPTLLAGSVAVADLIADLRPGSVGFHLAENEWEYPLLRLIMDRTDKAPAFSFLSTGANPQSSKYMEEPLEVVVGMGEPELTLHDNRKDLDFDLVAYYAPYGVYARHDLVAEMGGFRGPIPSFIGWEAVDGLDPSQGPFPEWDLPVVRWGCWPYTKLKFEGNGEPLRLEISFRRNNCEDQALRVSLNGKEIENFEFDSALEFYDLRIPLQTRKGENRLVFEYARQQEPGQLAVLFREIRVLPESEI